MPKLMSPSRSDDEIRTLVLHYFYDRNKKGRSERGKSGISAKISVIKRELRTLHGLRQSEVARALTYLIDQGWVKREDEHKSYATPRGTNIPSIVPYYRIAALGVDKIGGAGEFTMPKFHGINITATGQNIITLGDNNQIDSRHEAIANKLIDFKNTVRAAADINDSVKLSIIADVDTIESQLAKPEPNKSVLRAIWSGIEKLATATSLATNWARLSSAFHNLLS